MKNILKKQSGQALVEFLFVFFVFMAFILYTLQLTMLGNAKFMLNAAAYAACRKYVVTYSKEDAWTKAEEYIAPVYKTSMVITGIKLTHDNVQVSSAPEYGEEIMLELDVRYKIMPLPLIKMFFKHHTGNYIALRSTCTMTME